MTILLSIYIFLIGLLLVVYIIYPLLIHFIPVQDESFRNLSVGNCYLIIPAFNEEDVIRDKIQNAFSTFKKEGKIVVVSDGSTDKTDNITKELAANNSKLLFLRNEERGGKNTCLNYAVEQLDLDDEDILVFTDCNTFFDQDSIGQLLNTLKNGADFVGGSMKYIDMDSGSAKSEGLYWKYEEWIRQNESKLNRVIVANGGICAMWATAFKKIPAHVPNDFEGPLRILGNGGICCFNKYAIGIEKAIFSEHEELGRKQRMATRQMSCIKYLWKQIDVKSKIQVSLRKTFRWFGLHIFGLASLIALLLFLISGISIFLFLLHVSAITFILVSLAPIAKRNIILTSLRHAVLVHHYAAKGACEALSGSKKSIWNKASSNREK